MKKAILYIAGSIIYYLIAVIVLFILSALFKDSFKNIWVSAISVTIAAELILLINYLRKNIKCINK